MIYDDSYRDFDPYRYADIDYHEADFSDPACICADHFGTTPEFCPACKDWTDNIEVAMADAIGFAGETHPELADDPAFYAALRAELQRRVA